LWTQASDGTLSPPSAPDDDRARAAADAASALAGFLRVAGFYDAEHPVTRQRRAELEVHLHTWHRAIDGDGIVAAAGETLLITGLDAGLTTDVAKGFCATLIQKSVVGLRVRARTPTKDLADLFGLLGESDRRVRAAGGVTTMYLERGARGIDVFEMDLDQLLSGAPIDRGALDPLVAKALTEVLALKARANRRGSAIAVTLERVTTPTSLGSMLDELIDGAAPGVSATSSKSTMSAASSSSAAGAPRSPLQGLSADELADIGGEAFAKCAAGAANSPEALAEAARVLSKALVRLSPDARFKLLTKIAKGPDGDVAAVGQQVQNPLLMSAIAQVVMGGERDSKLAHAIGSLLERMRPIERDRQKFIAELEQTARGAGKPLDSFFLEQLNETSQPTSVGALDLPIRETRTALIEVARLRQRGHQPDVVLRTFASLKEEDRLERSARLLSAFLSEERVVVPATLTTLRGVLSTPPTDPTMANTGGAVISALWWRAVRDGPGSPASVQLAEVARSPTGADWCIALLIELRGHRGPELADVLTDLVRAVASIHQNETFRRRLTEGLNGLSVGVLRQMERRVATVPATAVQAFILRAAMDSPAAALALAQTALRAPSVDVKEATVRVLGQCADGATIAFLRTAAGADGDVPSIAALLATKEDKAALFRLQRTAIEALGATRGAAAVVVLKELLHRTRLVGGADLDRMRPFVARALTINGTREARAVVEDGRSSKSRSVRLACGASV